MMVKIVCLVGLIFSVEGFPQQPVYQYRYETEDLVRSPTSALPVHGFHMVQGGYYPYDMEHLGGQYGSFRPHVQNQFFGEQFGEINSGNFNKGRQDFEDGMYRNDFGRSGGTLHQGGTGSNQNAIGLQQSQANLGSYNDYNAGRKNVENGEDYQANRYNANEGENSQENKRKTYHKKGHVIKGFKNSHHKDEIGEDEEHYDEAFDEGSVVNLSKNSGQFGETGENSYKGGLEDKFYRVDENIRKGHVENKQFLDKINFGQNVFGNDNFLLGNRQLGSFGLDQQSLLGNQEAIKEYNHYIPFFHRR